MMSSCYISFLSLPPLPKIRHTSPTLINPSHSHSHSIRLVWGSRTSLKMERRSRVGGGPVCYASASATFSTQTLQWVSAIHLGGRDSRVRRVLMLAKGTTIPKSFLVPLFVLQAPASVISWIKGEYGTWATFLALLVRLFYCIPGGLDLPFLTMLLVIVAPCQTMNLRGSQAGAIISLVIAGYLAFQHFSKAGNLQRAFDQVSVIATLAIICITTVICLFLF